MMLFVLADIDMDEDVRDPGSYLNTWGQGSTNQNITQKPVEPPYLPQPN